MFLRTIESIRRKPKAVRQRYAFIVTVVFTAFITGIWSLSLPARFSAMHEGVVTASPERSSQAASVPFSGVWSQLKQQVSTLGGKSTSTSISTESTMTSVTTSTQTPVSTETFLLESGSTITFGATQSEVGSPSIMIGTTSTTSPEHR